ncbi:MAG: Fis family transcriptional regulator [Bradyrhizobium sp.]|nr:Fis family transcriptional regulator [Bradyrhizobium sp.]
MALIASPQPVASSKKSQLDLGVEMLRGSSPALLQLRENIKKVASTDAAVLLVGESGTGKELVAGLIHHLGARADMPFLPVNCGAIPEKLIEAELFGHEKGSFTGAAQRRIGCFEHIAGGTVLLDEVTEMLPDMQVKLLRVLETGSFHRVGGMEPLKADMRVIAATNRDPGLAVREGRFREDLLYRLAVFPLRVPPLREREGDVEVLAQHFLAQFDAAGRTHKAFSQRALQMLRRHNWPGNVRELKNTVQRAWIMADGEIDTIEFNAGSSPRKPMVEGNGLSIPVGTPLEEAQREIILATLRHFEGDKRHTAKVLGVSLKTLYNRLEAIR